MEECKKANQEIDFTLNRIVPAEDLRESIKLIEGEILRVQTSINRLARATAYLRQYVAVEFQEINAEGLPSIMPEEKK